MLTRRRGFPTHVNQDVFNLVYDVGARYERSDKHAYEPAIYHEWTGALLPGMTVLDIGAHYGFFSLAAALRVGSEGRVYAFEPAPATLQILRDHVRLNRLDNRMTVVPQVVGDAEGEVKFYFDGTSMSASVGRSNIEELCPQHHDVITETIVPCTTIDAFCRAQSIIPGLIKIDVEGAELLALRGAVETLRNVRPQVLCEIHPLQMMTLGYAVHDLERFLAGVGYTMTRIDQPSPQGIFHAWLARPVQPIHSSRAAVN
ncbi:MAG TPA: FkbM family methyltransferase [Gemmatimonadaceae bacterium]|nr:FkbM family methyltransferase [Gemmatimonadaceae bacterium]